MPGQFTGISGATENKLAVDANGAITTVAGGPAGGKFYVYAVGDVPGVVAANNFLSVFNPGASGKAVVFYGASIVPWAGGAATVTVSMRTFRTTAASAGTLIAAANVGKFVTTDANASAEVRIGNPTVTTTGLELISVPPAITSAGAGVGAQTSTAPPGGAGFVCTPGQGVVFSTTSGDVDQLWNFQIIWAEI